MGVENACLVNIGLSLAIGSHYLVHIPESDECAICVADCSGYRRGSIENLIPVIPQLVS